LLFDIQQDVVQVNDWLVQLGLDVKQIHHTVMGDDNLNLFYAYKHKHKQKKITKTIKAGHKRPTFWFTMYT